MMKLKSLLSRPNCILTESPFMSILFLSLLMLIGGSNSAKAADVEWDVKNGYSYSYSGTKNVTLKNRTFAANTWEGLCLPFSVSAETMASVFGEGYNLQEFDSYENNTIKFKKATDVVAGKPYYIKITSAVSDPVFNSVTFGSSLSGWQDVAVEDNISFRGFYYKIADYQLVDGQSTTWCFWLSGTTLLGKNSIPYNENGRVGTQSFFFVKKGDANTPTPSISFEGGSSDGDNTGGGNTGGGNTGGGNTGGGNTGSGIQMGVKTEITGEWGGNTTHQIPASAFLSDAQSAILQFVGTNYCLITNTNTDTTIREFQWNDANQMGVTLVLTGDLLQAAKNGYLALKVNGGSNYKLYVSNFATETPIREQLTDLPTIYLTVPAAINKDINSVLKKENGEAPYYQATIQVVDNSKSLQEFTDSKLEIKVRGNSTADGMKRPYRLKFAKDEKDPVTGEVITSHKHDLLGAGYSKRNWVLMANAFDGSMVRNALSYRVGQLVGMDFCPGWKFVDLVINEEYRGTYMVSDHLEVGNHRIDVDEDTGWYIEANGQERMAEEPYTSGGGLTLSIKNPEPTTEAETAALKSAVSTFFTDLSAKFNASNSADPTTGWRSMADEESLLAFWLGVNISANYDGFMTVKMFRDVDDPRIHFGPLWDHDLAWGNYTDNLGHRIEEGNNGNFNQLMRKAWADPLFVKKLHAKWHQLVNAGLKQDLLDYVDMLATTIKQSEALNHQKWTTYQAGFETSDFTTHAETIDFLRNFIDKHIDGIQKQIDDQYEALKDLMPEEGPEDGPDDTPVGELGALVDLGNGKYSYTGSASTFKKDTEITITTSENTTLSNYITEGNAWNTSKTITLTTADVTALAANSYTFYMNATGGEVKAVNVKVPVASTGAEFNKEYISSYTSGDFVVPASNFNANATSIKVILKNNLSTYSNGWNGNYGFDGHPWKAAYSWTTTNTQEITVTDTKDIQSVAQYGMGITGPKDMTVTVINYGTSQETTTPTYALTLNASEGGTVTGAGEYAEGTTVLIKAIPNEGYKFVKWLDDNTYASRSVTLNEAVTLTATFAAEGSADEDPFNEQGTRKQLTDLPTIYLNAETINGEWLQAAVEVFDKDNKLYQGATWKKEGLSKKGNINVAVQYQGSGADNSKNSYRLKFNDKINLLSATGSYKQWVLLANDDDPTMLNNALAKELGDAIGMPWTPGYQFVDLYVNDKYMGTYQLTDRVKAEEGRSLVSGGNKDLDWQVRFNDDAELEEDGTTDFVKTSGVNVIYRNPDPKDITSDALTTLKADMTAYFGNVFEETATNTFGNISENVDKQQLINWYIAQEILGVYKGFSSIEAYRSITEGAADNLLHFGPLWDSEKGFGNTGLAPKSIATEMGDLETEGSYKGLMIEYSAFEKMNKIFKYLWTQDWFKSGVKTKWDVIKTTLPTTLSGTITTLKGTIAASQLLNAQKWNTTTSYEDALTATNTYITNRFAYLEKKFNELAGAAHVHSYTAYIDNGDGTHSRKCSADEAVEEGSELHTLETNSDLKAHCAVCGYTSTDAIAGAQAGENVYVIKEYEKNNITYITATSNFTPAANTFYETATALPEEVNKANVIWKRIDGDYVANSVVISDGTAYNFDAKIHAKEAVYTRATGTSMWGTMCIPFKIAQSTEDYDIYQLESLSINKAQGTATLTFSPATKTSGELPLVYKRKENIASLTFNGVAQVDNGETAAEDVGYVTVKKSKNIGNLDLMNASGEWTLYGNVKAKTTIDVVSETSAFYKKQVYYFSGDKFIHCTGTVNVAPFRAFYVSTQDLSGLTNAKSLSIGIFDSEATRIENSNIESVLAVFIEQDGVTLSAPKAMNVNIFGLNGSKSRSISLDAGETRFISLAPGVYVVNNKKILIR